MQSRIRRTLGWLAFALVVLGPLALPLTACNTTEGAGKDISNTGHAISNTAEQAKPQ